MKEFERTVVVAVGNESKVLVDYVELLASCSINDKECFNKAEFVAVPILSCFHKGYEQ